jgi:hypothetical protein
MNDKEEPSEASMNQESTGDPSWNDEMMSHRAEGMAWQPWKANQEFEIRYSTTADQIVC